MKKKLIALLLSVLLVFTLAACSGENDEPATENGTVNEVTDAQKGETEHRRLQYLTPV